jgi:lipopolysaccharide/colanic/teichoic acid biosynthesis glycosyltransferase
MYYGKRLFDFIGALAGLIFLSPLLLVIAIAVRFDSPGPSFFLQERTGRFRRSFRIIKFRTMKQVTSGEASLITAAGDRRVTHVGRWLRKTKVDELPQLFNVLFGDMSLVGPRPEVPRYTRLYTEDQRQVFLARPGITSSAALASVNEEETLARQVDAEAYYLRCLMPAKLELDLAYCRSISFSEDVRLICRTLGRLSQSRNSEHAEENKLNTNAEELG